MHDAGHGYYERGWGEAYLAANMNSVDANGVHQHRNREAQERIHKCRAQSRLANHRLLIRLFTTPRLRAVTHLTHAGSSYGHITLGKHIKRSGT